MSNRDSGLPAMARRPSNLLLRGLPPLERAALLPFLDLVELVPKSTLIVPEQPVEYVHFVESGVVSMIATMEDGARVEVGLVGYEGLVGLPLLLGTKTSPLEGLIQVGGKALRLAAADVAAARLAAPALMPLLLRYLDLFQTQVAQTAACNARHDLVQRLARWLLMTHDRVEGDSFLMTQEFMSTLLGVRRAGVTLAIGALQRAGLAEHSRGILQVLDRSGLERVSCECYEVVRRRSATLGKPGRA